METKIRIENFFDFAKVPMGKTPKLTIKGKHQKSKVSAPLATTEAVLIAACSKGVKAFEMCGGVHAEALKERISRAPVFRFKSGTHAINFSKWIVDQFDVLKEIAESTTRHGKLIQIIPHIFSTTVHTEFVYTTGDAAGQNMTTIATQKVCDILFADEKVKEELGLTWFAVEGNMSSDKKLALYHTQMTRGVEVRSWAVLTKEVCLNVYKVHPKAVMGLHMEMVKSSVRSLSMGCNGNITNIIAAMFISCGQDVACIAESSWGQLTIDMDEDENLHFALYIPSLLVGTVGGGTGYETQKNCLEMINCYGPDKKFALAETIAAFCLALDMSTLISVATNTFSNAHLTYARL